MTAYVPPARRAWIASNRPKLRAINKASRDRIAARPQGVADLERATAKELNET